MYFKTQTFFLLGMSRSGIAAAEVLLDNGAIVYAMDEGQTPISKQNLQTFFSMGGRQVPKDEAQVKNLLLSCNVLVLSPGVPIDHPLAVFCKKNGKKIIGEMELGAMLLKNPSVAVTGTNGKTTTVGMIEKILKDSGMGALSCGNVGKPLCTALGELNKDDVAVIEVSSFQLESLYSLNSHVYVELNITQDHLNRHYTMENYIFLKERLLKNATESEIVVLNADDPIVSRFAERTKAKVVWFSLKKEVEGAYLSGDFLYYCGNKLFSQSDLAVSGAHNVANALAAICACVGFGVPLEKITAALTSFQGVRHRIERVGELNGVTFINDSKATNIDATIKAVESMKENCILLLGGKDKGYDYAPLFEYLKGEKKVVHSVVYGENAYKLFDGAQKADYRQISICEDMQKSVLLSYRLAREGQTVLLSPASSSFDAFEGYEERGEAFVSLFRELKENNDEATEYEATFGNE